MAGERHTVWQRLVASQEAVLAVLLVVCVVVMQCLSPLFLTQRNLFEMTRTFVEIGLMAAPMTVIIITAGIDLSVGSMMGLGAVLVGVAWHDWNLSIWAAMAVALAATTGAGFLNGALSAWAGIPPLIVTLATLAVYRGLATGISHARPIGDFPESFHALGQYYIAGVVPTQLLLLAVVFFAAWLVLAKTALGRAIYAVGANEVAARFSGIAVERVKVSLYSLSGLLSGLAGAVYVSRVNTSKSDAGLGYELDVITAVILGGVSIAGGEGTITGAVLGLLIISVLRNGLTLARCPSELQIVLIGALLIASVLFDRLVRRRG